MKTGDQPPLPIPAALEVLKKRAELQHGRPVSWEKVASETLHSKHTVLAVWRWFKGLSWEEANSLVGGSEETLRLRPDYLKEKVEEAQKAKVEQQVSSKGEIPVAVSDDKPQPQPSAATEGKQPEAPAPLPQRIEIPMRGAIKWLSTYTVGYSHTLKNGEKVSGAIAWNRPWTFGWRLEVYDPMGNRLQTGEGTQTQLSFSFVASLDGEYHLRVTNLGDVYTAIGTMEITPPGWSQTMG